MSSEAFAKLSRGQTASLGVLVCCAVISLIAINFIWIRVVVNTWITNGRKKVARERAILGSQLGAYVASLLFSNFLSSVTYIINATWASNGGVTSGSALCTAQGTLGQASDIAGAYFTGAIAVHTFNTLVLHHRLSMWFCVSAVFFGWILSIGLAFAPEKLPLIYGPFYAMNGTMCSISPMYPAWDFLVHLGPIFIALLVSIIFYSLVLLTLRGTLRLRGGLKVNFDAEARRKTVFGISEYPKFILNIARGMLWYPVAYVLFMLPHLIMTLLGIFGTRISFGWKLFALCCDALLGVANVLIFYNTVRIMNPAFGMPEAARRADPEKNAQLDADADESDDDNKSSVDVAPPVSQVLREKALPAEPRSLASSRQPSISSIGGDSTTALIPPQSKHTRSDSIGSQTSVSTLGRPITPPEELAKMINAPAPALKAESRLSILPAVSHRQSGAHVRPLPAPPVRKGRRQPIIPPPALPLVFSPVEPYVMSAVPLKTPRPESSKVDKGKGKERDSFIKMYGSRSPAPASIPAVVVSDNEVPPNTGSHSSKSESSEYSSEESDAPSSAFADRKQKKPVSARPRTLRTEVRGRLSTIESDEDDDTPPQTGGLSALRWATLVTSAATSNGGTPPSPSKKAVRRRSRSLDSTTVPLSLQPRVSTPATPQYPATAGVTSSARPTLGAATPRSARRSAVHARFNPGFNTLSIMSESQVPWSAGVVVPAPATGTPRRTGFRNEMTPARGNLGSAVGPLTPRRF